MKLATIAFVLMVAACGGKKTPVANTTPTGTGSGSAAAAGPLCENIDCEPQPGKDSCAPLPCSMLPKEAQHPVEQ